MNDSESTGRFAIGPHDFIDSLFAKAESERDELGRLLHDHMGGLLVAAAMDVSWIETNASGLSVQERAKFARLKEVLKEAIDLKRAIIERLRPTLLDTFGLFTALRWMVKHSCLASDITWTESYLDPEPQFKPAAAIALFRIVQEAVSLLLLPRNIRSLDLSVNREQENFVLRISVDGRVPAFSESKTHAFVSLQHRVRSLRGEIRIADSGHGTSLIAASLPCGEVFH